MIACLPMYERAETRGAHDRYWQLIRQHLPFETEPDLRRTQSDEMEWLNPALALGQTCGLPYRLGLHAKVALVGTPDYGLPDCPPGYYRSCFVVRSDDQRCTLSDFEGASFAYNGLTSQSGWAGPIDFAAEKQVSFGQFQSTGAHALSAQSVAHGNADIAAIDAMTWVVLKAHDPSANRLRVVDMTPPVPGLPYICAVSVDPSIIRSAVANAIADLTLSDRKTLRLQQIVEIPADDYLRLPAPPTLFN